MRLEDMSFTDYLVAECDLRERQRKERMKQAEFEKYAKEHRLFVCTKNILEQIKAEIEQINPYELPWDKRTPEHIRDMAIAIIGKYAEQEPTSPCDLCIFDRMDGDNKYCGYCGECPATAKGGE